MKPEFMSDQSDPSVKEWGRIMAARAHGHDLSADEADVLRLEDYGYVPPPGSAEWLGYRHTHGQVCVRTDKGYWMREGQGIDADALCDLIHPGGVPDPDPVNLPSHYTKLPVECIDVTEHFNFALGNAIKYIWRADHKGKPLEDLRKAVWYLQREIARRERTGD